MKRLATAAALALSVLGAPTRSLGEGEARESQATHESVEALLVEFANTPAEHQALASYYRGKADAARAESVTHRAMAKHYTGGKLLQREAMKGHCEALATKFEEVAADYEDLAAGHESEAKH